MIRKLILVLLKYKIWFSIIMLINIMLSTFLWLINDRGFIFILPTMILGSILIYSFTCIWIYKFDLTKKNKTLEFIQEPTLHNEELLLSYLYKDEIDIIRVIGNEIREKNELIRKQNLDIQEYKEYIESWAHEIKTPLSLMTFVLDNRKEEISSIVYQRLEYSRTKIQEDIERMLYYARLKSAYTDYLFSNLFLDEVCKDIIEEYKIFIEEQKINIINEVKDINIISDKKGLMFLLRQVISNSIKYKKTNESNPFIRLFTYVDNENGNSILTIRDNGIGVKSYDLPFLFNKGFTGDTGEYRKQSTGMGLYLAKQIADDLKIKIEVSDEYKDGFEISLLFPIVDYKKEYNIRK